jgi:hypothetical protein
MNSFAAVTNEVPNGLRYPRVGGTRQRHFAGADLKPHKLLENAQTPTRRVHAVLGSSDIGTNLEKYLHKLFFVNSLRLQLPVWIFPRAE